MDRDTLPPDSADAEAMQYAKRLASEGDTGNALLALPGSARFDHIAKHKGHALDDE